MTCYLLLIDAGDVVGTSKVVSRAERRVTVLLLVGGIGAISNSVTNVVLVDAFVALELKSGPGRLPCNFGKTNLVISVRLSVFIFLSL